MTILGQVPGKLSTYRDSQKYFMQNTQMSNL